MIDQIGRHTVYLILFNTLDATPMGVNCRLCNRPSLAQRATLPAVRPLIADES
jgi:XRE family transcriptional regulator, fatty acid utilization regulator